MLDERPGSETTAHIVSRFATQAGISVVTHLAANFFEKFMGKSYSQNDFTRYVELKRVYAQTLGREAPYFWELDEHKQPTHRIVKQAWPDYLKGLREGKEQVGNYYSQMTSIAEQVTAYLAARGKRWFGRGQPGDLLDLFMLDWLNFAVNELPTYRYDESSIHKIRQRLRYLVKVQKHVSLFKVGFIKRKKRKFEVLETIKQELLECERMTREEAMRECAREKLQVCCQATAKLWLASINTLYYGRALTIYDEPLNLRGFIDPAHTYLTSNARDLYPKVKNTHTGEMLHEILLFAGPETVGRQPVVTTQAFAPGYFNEDFSPKAMAWSSEKFDLPEWYRGKEAQARSYLNDTQRLAESILRLAKLKHLLEEVFDLTGRLGDLWVYGDQRGRLSLEGLLFSLEKELILFQERFEKLYQAQDTLRQDYVREKGIRLDKDVNQNFNKVDDQKDMIDGLYEPLKKAIKDLQAKLLEFSGEEVCRVDTRKEEFYQLVSNYIHYYYPGESHRFQLLDQPLINEEALFAFGFGRSCRDPEQSSRAVLPTLAQQNQVDRGFVHWRKNYFLQHKNDLINLGRLWLQFEKMRKLANSSQASIYLARQIRIHLSSMQRKVKAERPVWRLGWFYISLGWPFNRAVNRYIQRVVQDLMLLVEEVNSAMQVQPSSTGKSELGFHHLSVPFPQVAPATRGVGYYYKNNPHLCFAGAEGPTVGEEKVADFTVMGFCL